ncbi:low temperature requirement protein A [Cryptosporangium phraense]|uniref:Low temperature requirement protein A n=1 Tax=Cryptosporangium phraense TaxID=2593070 RepID=A0A545AI78_9ACTN|nr:low temperature requirement protein A [Cryptosporangium phraense]TQS41021.1 low temperature requirement protein A [Cryptosporangium phraense]
MTSETYEPIVRVTSLEVFFDLVFVFAITQLTTVLVDDPSFRGLARVVLMFGLIQWIYGGYVWLANAVAPDRLVRRLLMLLGMAGFLLIALGIPSSVTLFGLGYLVVVLVHTGLFMRSANTSSVAGIFRIAPFNLVSAVLLLVAGFVGYEYVFWTIALVLLAATPFLAPVRLFRVQVAHFVERYGLLLIIVLGESIVAIGVGVSGLELSPAVVLTALLALAVTAGLWWAYYTDDEERAEHALESRAPDQRARPALNSYFYSLAPMLLGVVVFAAGVKKTIGHPTEEAHWFAAVALAGGVGLYLLGHGLFRVSLGLPGASNRLVGAVLTLLAIPLGHAVAGAAELAVVLAIVVASVASDVFTKAAAEA